MAYDLSKVVDRNKLRPLPNRAPHWQRLRPRLHLGYRPSTDGTPGSWVAKVNVDGKLVQKALGSFGGQDSEHYAKAKAAAEAYATTTESGGVISIANVVTVADACRAYAETHPDAEGDFKRHVYDQPLGAVKLEKLARRHLKVWRNKVKTDTVRSGSVRAPASINRIMAPLRAALYAVKAAGDPKTEGGWQLEIKPIPRGEATRRREVYLTKDQRRELLACMKANDADAVPFFTSLCLQPVRPGATAKLEAGFFLRTSNELIIRGDKSHPERRNPLSAAAFAHLAAHSKGKHPAAPIFTRADGKAWNKDTWKAPIRRAVAAAGLDKRTCAYTLRHSVITDLVSDNVLSILDVANFAGTTTDMIQKHYGHLRSEKAREALQSLAL